MHHMVDKFQEKNTTKTNIKNISRCCFFVVCCCLFVAFFLITPSNCCYLYDNNNNIIVWSFCVLLVLPVIHWWAYNFDLFVFFRPNSLFLCLVRLLRDQYKEPPPVSCRPFFQRETKYRQNVPFIRHQKEKILIPYHLSSIQTFQGQKTPSHRTPPTNHNILTRGDPLEPLQFRQNRIYPRHMATPFAFPFSVPFRLSISSKDQTIPNP